MVARSWSTTSIPSPGGPSRTRRTDQAGDSRRSSSSAPGLAGITCQDAIGPASSQSDADGGHPPNDPLERPVDPAECEEIEDRVRLSALIATTVQQPSTSITGSPRRSCCGRGMSPRCTRNGSCAHPPARKTTCSAKRVTRAGSSRRVGDPAVTTSPGASWTRRYARARRRPVAAQRARVREVRGDGRRHPWQQAQHRSRAPGVGWTDTGEPLSVVLGTSGKVSSALPASGTAGARHVFCRGSGDVHAMGVDAQRPWAAALAARRSGQGDYGSWWPRRRGGSRARRGSRSSVPGRRAHRAAPTRTPAGRSADFARHDRGARRAGARASQVRLARTRST